MSDCLLLFCDLDSSILNKNDEALYRNSYNNLTITLGKDKVTELLRTKLDGIVVNVISRIFDLHYFGTVLSNSETILYDPEGTFYSVNVAHKIFKYIEVCCVLYVRQTRLKEVVAGPGNWR